ncbi:hypothetical protein K4F52_009484 [Lecanicillium sp. MT-2017a]|nr:hypothetical protein K4F52_009484 [Lecanicillium sp. MT-2017a]
MDIASLLIRPEVAPFEKLLEKSKTHTEGYEGNGNDCENGTNQSQISSGSSETELPTPNTGSHAQLPTLFSRAGSIRVIGAKGVLLGHWRDSPAPDNKSKHAVTGFIDARQRLLAQIQVVDKNGTAIADKYSVTSGSNLVKFNRIHFLDHLVGLDQYQIKEYVKIRSVSSEETVEDRIVAEKKAVELASERGRELLERAPPALQLDVAQGEVYSKHKRRRVSKLSLPAVPTDKTDRPLPRHPLDPLPGTRPARVIIGCWRGSSEASVRNKHAVLGVLSHTDKFRVRLVQETRDGRCVDGNFPRGAGALWINYDQVELEPHIKGLNRRELREYCRVRQFQIDHGESLGVKAENEVEAAAEAKVRVAARNQYESQGADGCTAPGLPASIDTGAQVLRQQLCQQNADGSTSTLPDDESHAASLPSNGLTETLPGGEATPSKAASNDSALRLIATAAHGMTTPEPNSAKRQKCDRDSEESPSH